HDLPLDYFNSEPGCYDVIPRGVSKWNGICRLAEHLGIAGKDIVTMGNWLNDMEMVVNAGVGVAVADAAPELKEAADYVTERTCDEDPLLDVGRDLFHLNIQELKDR
ncbi:MAG: HAD hydrolase family protein, partial [Firmicutes bacterium]|nr:HAD hydrolase family protein [Bacillota bacterium]